MWFEFKIISENLAKVIFLALKFKRLHFNILPPCFVMEIVLEEGDSEIKKKCLHGLWMAPLLKKSENLMK